METWHTIEEDKFSILFPEKPLHVVVPTPDPNNAVLFTHCYQWEPPALSDINFFYSISYIDYPNSDLHHNQFPLKIKYFLDAAVNNVVAGIFDADQPRVLSTNRARYAGRMIDVRALNRQFAYKIHLLLSDFRVYIIQTVTHIQWAENDKIKKFIASFVSKDPDKQPAAINTAKTNPMLS